MPGANSAIYGCGTARRPKYKGIGIFKVPSVEDKEKAEWRSELTGQILKDRVIDENLKHQIESGNLYICEKHFIPDCIEHCKYKLHKTYMLCTVLNCPGQTGPIEIGLGLRSGLRPKA